MKKKNIFSCPTPFSFFLSFFTQTPNNNNNNNNTQTTRSFFFGRFVFYKCTM